MKANITATLLLLPLIACLASCEKDGPAEDTGEKIDEVIEDVKDSVDPKGPVEKTGEKIDEALGN